MEEHLDMRLFAGDQPGYTYFAGRKNGVPACVLYLAARFKGGLPEAVIYLENSPSLFNLLTTDFQEKWDKANRLFRGDSQ